MLQVLGAHPDFDWLASWGEGCSAATRFAVSSSWSGDDDVSTRRHDSSSARLFDDSSTDTDASTLQKAAPHEGEEDNVESSLPFNASDSGASSGKTMERQERGRIHAPRQRRHYVELSRRRTKTPLSY